MRSDYNPNRSKKGQWRSYAFLIFLGFVAVTTAFNIITAPICDEICQIAEESSRGLRLLEEELDQ